MSQEVSRFLVHQTTISNIYKNWEKFLRHTQIVNENFVASEY